MAIFNDSLGRPGDSGRHSVDELRGMIANSVKKPLPMPAKPAQDNSGLADALRKVTDNLDGVMAGDKATIDALKSMAGAGSSGGDDSGRGLARALSPLEKAQGMLTKVSQATHKQESKLWKDEGKVYKAMLTKGSIWVRDPYVLKVLEGLANQRGTPGPIDFSAPSAEAGVAEAKRADHAENLSNMIGQAGNLFLHRMNQAAALFIGGDFLKGAFQGAISEEMEFMKGAREIAYVTQGITGETDHLQMEWQDVGKTVRMTGVRVGQFQKAYLKNLRAGYKTQTQTIELTKTGLSLGTAIGADADQTADMFQKWHMNFAQSNIQLQQMSRGMQNVARNVGLTGDSMLAAVKSSEKIMENLRNAGTFSASAAENMTTAFAAAQKTGVEGAMAPILEAATGMRKFIELSGGDQSLAINAARIGGGGNLVQELLDGTLGESKESLKKYGQGFNDLMKTIIGVDEISEDAINNLDPLQKRIANLRLSAFGIELGQVARVSEAMAEAGKTFENRLADITIQLNKGNLTTQEHMALIQRRTDLEIGEEMRLLSVIAQRAKQTGDLSNAMTSLNGEGATLKALLGAGAAGGNKEQTGALMQRLVNNLNAQVKKFDVDGKNLIDPNMIQQALSDPIRFRELVQKMGETEQAITVAQKKNLDPMTAIGHKMDRLNETFRAFTQPALNWLSSIAGANGIIVAQLTAMTALFTAGRGAAVAHSGLNFATSMFGSGTVEKMQKMWAAKDAMASSAATGMRKGLSLSSDGFYSGDFGQRMAGQGRSAMGKIMSFDIGKLFDTKMGKVFTSTLRVLPGFAALESSLIGMGTVGGNLASILGIAGSSAGAFAGTLAAVVGGFAALTAGMVSGFMAGEKAAHIFNVEQDKVTMAMKMSAEEAGFFTGILNVLTLGFFRKHLGPTGTWTQGLAKFFEALGPMKYLVPVMGQLLLIVDALMLVFKVLWGVLKGIGLFIYEVFIGAWNALKEATKPVVEVMQYLWQTLKDAFAPLHGVGAAFSDVGGIVGILSKSIQFLGKVLGFILTTLGQLIGFILKLVVPVVKLLIDVFGWLAKGIVMLITPLWAAFQGIFGFFKDILSWFGVVPKEPHNAPPTPSAAALEEATAGSLAVGKGGALEKEHPIDRKERVLTEKANKALTTPGSAYVHDIHCEALLKQIVNMMSEKGASVGGGGAAGGGGGGGGGGITGSFGAGAAAGIVGALTAAGLIALAVWKSGPIIASINALKPLVKPIMKGAVTLTLITGAVLSLGTAIMAMGRVIERLGFTPAVAFRLTTMIASLLAGSGAIAWAVLAASPALSILGKAWGKIPMIASGAAVLVTLTAVVLTMGTAIMGMGKIIQALGFSVQSVVKTTMTVAAVLAGAGAIGYAALLAAPSLFALGGLWSAIPMIASGAALLVVLTAILLTMGAAIMGMGMALTALGMTPQNIAKTTLSVAMLLGGAGLIGYAALLAAPSLFVLGNLWPAIPMIASGAALLTVMTAILLLMGAAIMGMGMALTALGLTPQNIAHTTLSVALMLGGAGLIAYAALVAAPSLFVLGSLWPAIPMIASGAALLTVMTGILLLLGAAIMGIGMALTALGLTPQNIAHTTLSMALMLGGAGLIAYAALQAAPGLALANALWPFIPAIGMGALAIGALTGIVLLLGAAIMGVGNALVALGLTPGNILYTTTAMVLLLAGAGLIAYIALTAAPGLALANALWPFIPVIGMGALAMLALSSIVIGLGAAIMGIGAALIALGLTPGNIARITLTLVGLLTGAGLIAWLTLQAIPPIASFVLLIPFIPLIATGAGVMLGMTAGILALGAAIIGMGALVTMIPNPLGIALKVAAVLLAAGLIAGMVLLSAYGLMQITGLGLVIGLIFMGAGILMAMVPAMVAMSNAILESGKAISKGFNEETTTQLVEGISNASIVLDKLAGILHSFKEKIAPLAQPGYIFFGDSDLDKITYAAEQMGPTFNAIARLVNKVMLSVETNFGSLKKMKIVADKLQQLGPIMEEIPKVMQILAEKIQPLFEGGWFSDAPAEKIMQMVPKFTYFFESIAEFIAEGIINAIQKNIKYQKDEKDGTLKKIKFVQEVIGSVGPMMQTLMKDIQPLTEDGWFSDAPIKKLTKAIPVWRKHFEGITKFITEGIIEPIEKNIQFREEGTLSKLEQIPGVLEGAVNVITSMQKHLVPMTKDSGWWFWKKQAPLKQVTEATKIFEEHFSGIARFMNEGIIEPVQKHLSVKKQKATVKRMELMMEMLQFTYDLIRGLQHNLVPMTKGSGILFWKKEAPLKQITGATRTFEEHFKKIAAFLKTGIIEPIRNEFTDENELETAATQIESIAKIIKAIAADDGVIILLQKNLAPMVKKSFWSGKAPIDKIKDATEEFTKHFEAIAAFIQDGLIKSISEGLPDPAALKAAADKLEPLQELISRLAGDDGVITNFVGRLSPLIVKGFWGRMFGIDTPMEAMVKALPDLKSGWEKIIAFIEDGLIKPMKNLPDLEKLETASSHLSELGTTLSELQGILKSFGKDIAPLTTTGFWEEVFSFGTATSVTTQIEKAMPALKETVNALAGKGDKSFPAYMKGISENIDLETLKTAETNLKAIPAPIMATANAIKTVAEELAPLTSADNFWPAWIIGDDAKDAVTTIKAISGNMKSVLGALTASDGIISLASAESLAVDKIKTAKNQLATMSGLFSPLAGSIKKIGEDIAPITSDKGLFGLWNSTTENAVENIQKFGTQFGEVLSAITFGLLHNIDFYLKEGGSIWRTSDKEGTMTARHGIKKYKDMVYDLKYMLQTIPQIISVIEEINALPKWTKLTGDPSLTFEPLAKLTKLYGDVFRNMPSADLVTPAVISSLKRMPAVLAEVKDVVVPSIKEVVGTWKELSEYNNAEWMGEETGGKAFATKLANIFRNISAVLREPLLAGKRVLEGPDAANLAGIPKRIEQIKNIIDPVEVAMSSLYWKVKKADDGHTWLQKDTEYSSWLGTTIQWFFNAVKNVLHAAYRSIPNVDMVSFGANLNILPTILKTIAETWPENAKYAKQAKEAMENSAVDDVFGTVSNVMTTMGRLLHIAQEGLMGPFGIAPDTSKMLNVLTGANSMFDAILSNPLLGRLDEIKAAADELSQLPPLFKMIVDAMIEIQKETDRLNDSGALLETAELLSLAFDKTEARLNASAQPANTPDIHGGMRQEMAGAQPAVAMVASDELVKLAAKAESQHETMKEQLVELKNIVAAITREPMTGGGPGLIAGETAGNIVGPMGRLNTNWPQTYLTSANKQSPNSGGEAMT